MATGAAKLAWENSRAQNGSLLVLMAIAFETESQGNCIMTVAELGRKARLSERAVQNAVRDLTALGELSATHGPGRGKRNRYSLCLLNPAESAPFDETPQNLHPAESAPFNGHSPSSEPNPAKSAPFEIPDALKGSVVSGRRSKPSTSEKRPKPPEPSRPDVDRLCGHLADRIAANGSKRPNITRRWRTAARLLLDADGRTEEDVHKAIDWCQQHHFWHRNILSMEKLREQYDRLRLDAKAEREKAAARKPQGRPDPDEDYAAALQRIRARKENANGNRGDSGNRPAGQVALPAAAD